MAFEQQQRTALRIINTIEDGTTSNAEIADQLDRSDSVLVYLLITWMRKFYADHPNGDAVLTRLGSVTAAYPAIGKKLKEGKDDSVVEWFEDAYRYKDLDAKAFVALVVDKLES